MKSPQQIIAFLAGLVALQFAAGSTVHSADWPQFLGAQRNGTATESGLIDSFGPEGPQVAWRVRGGVGMSAVAVAGRYAVTTWNDGDHQWLVALDARTGETVWRTPIAPDYTNAMGDGPRATPAIADGTVFVYSGEGRLCAADLKTGQLRWQTEPTQQSGVDPAEYGMASSPLLIGGRVIVHVGGTGSAICAFDANSGQRLWATGSGAAGYSSPTVLTLADQPQIVSLTGSGLTGVEPATGKQLWHYPFETPYDCNTATPISVDGGVFISAGENHGCVLLDVQKDGDRYRVSERWTSIDGKSVMRNEWQTSVVVGDFLYGFDNVGSAGPVTHLSCIGAQTGTPVWSEKRFGKGNVTLADGKLWITTMAGELVLVRATPQRYEELGRAQLFGKTRQSLSIAGGFGYIRDDREVICLKLTP